MIFKHHILSRQATSCYLDRLSSQKNLRWFCQNEDKQTNASPGQFNYDENDPRHESQIEKIVEK